ncbi:MAG: PAS domain S-box protein [bacterium]|nr:PAS domain S-box protein [bacterium]
MRIEITPSELERFIEEIEPIKSGFDLLDDHVIITDKDANILYANKAVQRNTGFSIHEILGKNPGDLWGGEMPKEFYERMWQSIKAEKKPFLGEVHNKKKDGVEYWQDLYVSPILNADGEIKFFIGIEPNITERYAEERFHKDFLSVFDNQLRDPFAAIKWVFQWIFQNNPSQKDQRRTLESSYQKDKWLVDLVADLLVISSLKSIGAGNTEETIDIGDEIEGIILEIKNQHANTSFTYKKDGERFPLVTKKHFATQVFSNIIHNGAEYSTTDNGKVIVALKKEGDGYVFSCENNGLSIPQKEQTKIFTQFFRASNARMMKEGGTGLGLFIVKVICDKLGWNVQFQSPRSEGDGAIFSVKIPVRQA